MLQFNIEGMNSPIRQIKGKAELYTSSALAAYGKYVTFENVDAAAKVKVKASATDGADIVGSTITVGGKNLIDVSQMTTENETGSVYGDFKQNEDGSYTFIKDGAGANGWQSKVFPLNIKANTRVYLSADILRMDENFYLMARYANGGQKGVLFNSSSAFIPTDDVISCFFYTAQGNESGTTLIAKNIQLEYGETATEYEPYKEPTVYTIDETLTVEAAAYAPTTVIYPNNSGVFIEKAECNVCTCADTFPYDGALQEIVIERAGEESKFFGFGVCQKLKLKLRDIERDIKPTTQSRFKIYFAAGDDNYISNFPLFSVTETNRDENTNALSITAYDCIKEMEKHTVAELGLTSYTIKEFATAAAALFGLSIDIQGVEDFTLFDLEYAEGANFEGTESIRAALTAAAEATQTIYYVTESKLVFKRLASADQAALTIGKDAYFSLDTGDNRRLQSICNTTELGDAVTASISAVGTTQFIRDNPFLELREDIADILDTAIAAVGGLTINQFSCSWRGNYLVEIGDKLGIITKDNDTVYSYLLNDAISYNGALSESTQWEYTDNNESASNPTTLGEAIKQTYAKVDKANKQIEMVVGETDANSKAIAALQINTESISASVQQTQESTEAALEGVNDTVNTFKQEVTAAITAESAKIEVIQEELENGVAKVKTATGYEFSDDGLIIDKTGAETNSKLNESGLTVGTGSKEMLFAGVKDDNGTKKAGVFAEDLHATSYLIVGSNSRFEDYGSDRTGCFWIGGN